MLRNILTSALSKSLLSTSWQAAVRTPERLLSHGSSVLFTTPKFKEGAQRKKIKADGALAEPAEGGKLDFITKVGFQQNNFPNEKTPELLFDGTPFKLLPIIVVKSHKNNTKLCLHQADGKAIVYRSAGIEGFKKAKKGTSVGAYVTSVTFSRLARKNGVKNVRLQLNGFGRGRDAVIKGFVQAGLNIVSVSDTTHVSAFCPRPKKVRRV